MDGTLGGKAVHYLTEGRRVLDGGFLRPGARVVAQGERQGQRLVLNFPYAEGAFRDTFTWRPASASWSLLLESQRADGAWSKFASYTLTRGAPHGFKQ